MKEMSESIKTFGSPMGLFIRKNSPNGAADRSQGIIPWRNGEKIILAPTGRHKRTKRDMK
jgi:hypothetical protein